MQKILIVSDTHGDVNQLQKIIKIEKPNYVLHAGDHCVNEEEIKKIVNYVAKGNNDFYGDDYHIFTIENVSFFLCHGHKFVNLVSNNEKISQAIYKVLKEKNLDVGIFGHTHIEYFAKKDNKIFINPGSLILPRNTSQLPTYAIIHVDNGKIIESDISQVIKFNNENY